MPPAAPLAFDPIGRRVAVVTATFAALLSLVGCASSTLPPALSAAEVQRWNGVRFNDVVAVEAFKYPIYSENLASALRDTHLFSEVGRVGEVEAPPTLIARVEEEDYGGVATIPIWTILTLGIIPTVEREGFGYHFSIRRPDGSQPPTYVSYDFTSTDTLGWIALFEALSPDVGLGSPEQSERYHGRFALSILDRIALAHP